MAAVSSRMKLYTLRASQHLPISVHEAWDFFSDPRNLPRLTPSWLDFKTTSEAAAADAPAVTRMYPGMIITYRIRPALRIPVGWTTEITHVRVPFYFVDEQRFGPYRFWHHQHFFVETEGGVEVRDIVHYGLRGGALGRAVNRLMVRPRLEEIFDYRRRVLGQLFDGAAAAPRTPAAPQTP